MPDRVIIADTSCFIVLEKIGELDLLHQVYGQVVTTVDIAKEYGNMLPDWVVLVAVQDAARQQLIEIQLDKGESSAIALALEISGSLIILDDAKARRFAERLRSCYNWNARGDCKSQIEWDNPVSETHFRKNKTD
jgi:predicted nucleic acid-binding protein